MKFSKIYYLGKDNSKNLAKFLILLSQLKSHYNLFQVISGKKSR